MVFSSAIFLFAFLPPVFIVYRLLPGLRAKNAWLALASIVFYAFGQLQYVPLFLLSVALNYGFGRLLQLRLGCRRALAGAAVMLNLGVLCLFKYTDFLLGAVNSLTGASIPLPGITLPIGISFFTFQGLSYVIDVYRDRESGARSFFKVLLYIAFFPQLIAGPIVKYHDIAEQIDWRKTDPALTADGIRRFITGLAKKLLISNAAGLIADTVFDTLLPSGALDFRLAWLGAVCYTLQIYFDFSGYSDMAIGLGRMFGFEIKENFNYPYASLSMREFWRRWHISLSAWFREYLYIPLGGNRRGRVRTLINRMTVFLCTGIWHGANYTFILWGVLHGALTCLEDAGVLPVDRLRGSRAGRLLCRVYTLLSVTLLFVLFRASSVHDALALVSAMFTAPVTAAASYQLGRLLTPAAALTLGVAVLAAAGAAPALDGLCSAALGESAQRRVLQVLSLALLALSLLCLSSGGFNPFIYFQF
ncbi:MAG: MBOAT family protein [Butyricicoccus sp.]|nr:MBOAT family protein [Butyricicoccus sp.]